MRIPLRSSFCGSNQYGGPTQLGEALRTRLIAHPQPATQHLLFLQTRLLRWRVSYTSEITPSFPDDSQYPTTGTSDGARARDANTNLLSRVPHNNRYTFPMRPPDLIVGVHTKAEKHQTVSGQAFLVVGGPERPCARSTNHTRELAIFRNSITVGVAAETTDSADPLLGHRN